MNSPAIWTGLPPPEAPNSRTPFTSLNRNTSMLHILAPFAARLNRGTMLTGMLNLRRLPMFETGLERCFAAAMLALPEFRE